MAYKTFLYLIAASQLVLGALYLAVPGQMIAWQGLGPMPADLGYPLAMLAARFLVYGVGMGVIARDPIRHRPWALGMAAIQLIDLGAGAAYVATGIVPLSQAAFPMLNAALFATALVVLDPGRTRAAQPA